MARGGSGAEAPSPPRAQGGWRAAAPLRWPRAPTKWRAAAEGFTDRPAHAHTHTHALVMILIGLLAQIYGLRVSVTGLDH